MKLVPLSGCFALLALLPPLLSAQNAPPPLKPLPPAAEEAPASLAPVIPADVIEGAVAAVAALGQEVVQGRYQAAIDSMNPMWKERTARRMGGMPSLEKQLAATADEMVRQGIRILSFKPSGRAQAYEVWPGKETSIVNGTPSETLIYTKWLVLVPTIKTFEMRLKGDPRPVIIESTGYQVAVRDKDKQEWSFIDGSGTSLNELRSLFITLPADLKLPPLEKRELR